MERDVEDGKLVGSMYGLVKNPNYDLMRGENRNEDTAIF